ncbi:hypothetical protein LMH73_014725 [Vibrio splendidus]|nr:hypothetical protein [Vibrio splendidus]MCC4882928.1 hypothetical protein [Vibrio splendidus]
MTYKYVCPTSKGAKKVEFSYADHQRLFPNLRLTALLDYEYFLFDNRIEIHRYDSAIVLAVEVMVIPINLILIGLANLKEFKSHYRTALNQRKHGGFFTTMYFNNQFDDFSQVVNAAVEEAQCL